MCIDRLKALDINHRELFTAIYGMNGSSEVYITKDLRVHNLREALYLYLKEEGYTTLFYDDKAFSYEEEPLLEFFNFSSEKGDSNEPTRKKDFFIGKGPMSKSRNLSNISNTSTPKSTEQSHHASIRNESSGNQRRFRVEQSEGFFKEIFAYSKRNPHKKLAVVFVTPATLKFDDDQRRVILNLWNDLKTDYRRNKLAIKIISLYDFDSAKLFTQAFDSASDELLFLSPFKDLIKKDIGQDDDNTGKIVEGGRKDKTVFFLGDPFRDEIGNMLNRRRLMTKEGLPHLFGKIEWDFITLRLWQGMASGKSNLSLICDYLDCDNLDEMIERMDTVKAIDRLNSLEGIDNIREQFALYRQALAAHRRGSGSGRFRPHMALMGSPGTGKSTVARLFGDILREDGLLPKGHFVKVSCDELIGQYIGETRPKTRAVCEKARGGILFIDEAYGLMSGKNSHGDVNYGAEAIEVLIQFMEDNDDSLVILAGYTDEITDLINEGNKGFRRRFNELGFFEFKDYSPDVLYRIASKMIKVPTTENFHKSLKGIIRSKWAYRNKKFGNVGDMENLINQIVSHYTSLNTHEALDTAHLPNELRILVDESLIKDGSILAELNGILGQQEVKAEVSSIVNKLVADRIKLQLIDNYTPQLPKLNFLFTGNPGTGKTTVARIIGRVLEGLGVFPPSKGNIITEVSGNDLLPYTPADVKKLFEDNIGKVLFIDEAYQLRESPRVVADIVANVELLEYKNKLSVIMAGYPQDMRELMNVNVGLPRRFKEVPFSDYSNEDLYEILVRKVETAPNTIMDSEQCRIAGISYFASLQRGHSFGNAGEAENLLGILCANRDDRFIKGTLEQRNDRDFAQRIFPCDFPNYSDTVSHPSNSTQDVADISVGITESSFDGTIDCTAEDEQFGVAKGNDIYNSVGLLESEKGMGTAFIISVKNRYVITASHVVEGNSKFKFTLNFGDRLFQTNARLLWNNAEQDFAILQLDSIPEGAKYFVFDTATAREPATSIRIVAFPLGRQVSSKAVLTSGAISNYEENLTIRNEDGTQRRFNAIRTEAQATHGSSGGPVVLADSMKVIGVLHGGMNESGFFMNVASDISQIFNESNLRFLK